MPAKRPINLLPRDSFATSVGGRLLIYSITVGRYVVVFTELIVILAFLSRFYLDTQISDLNDKIKSQVALIEANSSFENNFRLTQARLTAAGNFINSDLDATILLDKLTPLVPSEITVNRVSYQDGTIGLIGSSPTIVGVQEAILSFKKADWLTNVTVVNVAASDATGGALKFTLSADVVMDKLKRT